MSTSRKIINIIILLFTAYYIVFFVRDLIEVTRIFRPKSDDIALVIFAGVSVVSLLISLFIKNTNFIKWVWIFTVPYFFCLIKANAKIDLLMFPAMVIVFCVLFGLVTDNTNKDKKEETEEANKRAFKEVINYKKIGYFIVAIIALIFLFLFALNGRYVNLSEGAILDKWSGTVKYFPSEEIPILSNGKRITKYNTP